MQRWLTFEVMRDGLGGPAGQTWRLAQGLEVSTTIDFPPIDSDMTDDGAIDAELSSPEEQACEADVGARSGRLLGPD
jgi:hypothetical protein